jgi:hypothetical protein
MGTKNAKNGSEAEPKEIEHGGKVIADQILILLISKADGIMTRRSAIIPSMASILQIPTQDSVRRIQRIQAITIVWEFLSQPF